MAATAARDATAKPACVQLMKANPGLDDLCERAVAKGVFGTKMRSVVNLANPAGIKAIVDQQFAEAARIAAHGLVPIIEPEVNIKSAERDAEIGRAACRERGCQYV